jgi:uncharacterized protein YbbK (DUF523 family)
LNHVKPKIGISRCLLGDQVRYDGTHKRDDSLIEALGQHVEWVPVCPEVEVGMGTPREPIQLVASVDGVPSANARVRLVGVESGRDWTEQMHSWARQRVAALRALNLSGFVLKARSPSCGIEGVRVVHGPAEAGPSDDVRRGHLQAADETFNGRGLFAQALVEAMPDLPVEDEARLSDPHVRDQFLARVRHRATHA